MMKDKILSEYQSDHLILLIGGNPLPNAVAGYALSKPSGTITLLHSGDTAVTAQKLYTWLHQKSKATIQFKHVDEASPASITEGTLQQLNAIPVQTVGLHYTGGTKAMSVHAYRTMEQWAKEQHKASPIYSYLDARTLSLVVDAEQKPIPLAEIIRLEFTDLLALHGWTLKSKVTTTPILPKFAQALLKLYSSNNLTAWETWKEQELRAKCRRPDRPDKWLSKTNLNQITLAWPQAPELAELVQALREELQQGPDGLNIQTATLAIGFKHPETLCRQLDGGYWLETCVLQALLSIAEKYCLHDVCMNIEPTIGNTEFELDVLAIRDYQLYGVSCGTDTDSDGDRGHLKLKLFEAYVRAQQLGGDEARAALVCAANDPAGLEAEMRRDLSPHVKVFGRKHLANLATEFACWIKPE
jgi:hypothetical protein